MSTEPVVYPTEPRFQERGYRQDFSALPLLPAVIVPRLDIPPRPEIEALPRRDEPVVCRNPECGRRVMLWLGPQSCWACQDRREGIAGLAEEAPETPSPSTLLDVQALSGVPVPPKPAEANLGPVLTGPPIVHPAGPIPADIEARMARQAAAVKAARTSTPVEIAPPGSRFARAIRRLFG